jgi:hypothetical protein
VNKAKFENNQLWINKPFLKELLNTYRYTNESVGNYSIQFNSYFASYFIVEKMNANYYKIVPTTSRNNERPALQMEAYWELCKDRNVTFEGEIPLFYKQWYRNRGMIKEGLIKEKSIKVQVDRSTVNLPEDRKALQQFGQIWEKVYSALGLSPDQVNKYKGLIKKIKDSATTQIDPLAGIYSFMGNLFNVEVDKNKLRKYAPTPWRILFAGHSTINAGVNRMKKSELRQIIKEELKSILEGTLRSEQDTLDYAEHYIKKEYSKIYNNTKKLNKVLESIADLFHNHTLKTTDDVKFHVDYLIDELG